MVSQLVVPPPAHVMDQADRRLVGPSRGLEVLPTHEGGPEGVRLVESSLRHLGLPKTAEPPIRSKHWAGRVDLIALARDVTGPPTVDPIPQRIGLQVGIVTPKPRTVPMCLDIHVQSVPPSERARGNRVQPIPRLDVPRLVEPIHVHDRVTPAAE